MFPHGTSNLLKGFFFSVTEFREEFIDKADQFLLKRFRKIVTFRNRTRLFPDIFRRESASGVAFANTRIAFHGGVRRTSADSFRSNHGRKPDISSRECPFCEMCDWTNDYTGRTNCQVSFDVWRCFSSWIDWGNENWNWLKQGKQNAAGMSPMSDRIHSCCFFMTGLFRLNG